MEENLIITLNDNKEYLIVSKVTVDYIDYYYLCSTKKPLEIKIAVIKNKKLEFVEDSETLTYIFNKFVYKMKQDLNIVE